MMKKAWYKYLIIGSVVFLAIVAIIFVIDKKNKTRITNSDKNLQVSGDNIQIVRRRLLLLLEVRK